MWTSVDDKEPEEKGHYLTIRKYEFSKFGDPKGDVYSKPQTTEFTHVRYRDSGRDVLDENGKKENCWMKGGHGQAVDYWMPLPPTQKIKPW